MKCKDCGGSGKLTLFTSVEKCKKCGGSGEIADAKIVLDIPAGGEYTDASYSVTRQYTVTNLSEAFGLPTETMKTSSLANEWGALTLGDFNKVVGALPEDMDADAKWYAPKEFVRDVMAKLRLAVIGSCGGPNHFIGYPIEEVSDGTQCLFGVKGKKLFAVRHFGDGEKPVDQISADAARVVADIARTRQLMKEDFSVPMSATTIASAFDIPSHVLGATDAHSEIDKALADARAELAQVKTQEQCEAFRIKWIGVKGWFTLFYRRVGPAVGKDKLRELIRKADHEVVAAWSKLRDEFRLGAPRPMSDEEKTKFVDSFKSHVNSGSFTVLPYGTNTIHRTEVENCTVFGALPRETTANVGMVLADDPDGTRQCFMVEYRWEKMDVGWAVVGVKVFKQAKAVQ